MADDEPDEKPEQRHVVSPSLASQRGWIRLAGGPDVLTAADAISRAIQRTVLASRCLNGAAEDVRAFVANGGLVGEVAADVLQSEALRLEQIAEHIEELRE